MSVNVGIINVDKYYGSFQAIDDISLDIKEGEFFTLLGPSGCGKTTLLRMIAGFNSIEAGQIKFGEQVINNVAAHKRNIGMVFQNYAVFPHLTVYDNVAYGLKARKIGKDEAHRRIMEALEVVQIEKLKDRMPANLSGGQQQRVALARAIVIEPEILLMDEPLSNLDAKLRVQMRTVIRKIQKQLNITTIYVTHDQEEALAISDRIAVMSNGVVQQVDNPEVIYKKPANKFVSNFIGTSNFIEGTVVDNQTLKIDDYIFKFENNAPIGDNVLVSVRPEQFEISETEGIKGKIILSTFLGDFINYEVELENGSIIEVNEYTGIMRESDGFYVKPISHLINVYDLEGSVRYNVE